MRNRDKYVSLFRATGCNYYFELTRHARNNVNQMIRIAKSNYIRNQLYDNCNNPKKFWRVIDRLINPSKSVSLEPRFHNETLGEFVEIGAEADFLNDYFINIVNKLGIVRDQNDDHDVYDIANIFSFEDNMPTLDEINKIIFHIDVTKSSCVPNIISARFCKDLMLAVPNVVLAICNKTLVTGKIPRNWIKGTITVLPRDGDLTDPGKWRPITQTSIFAKHLEKLVHTRLLKYFLDNHILSDYQFGFLPGRSTQLAVFELTKQIYLALNNKKIFGSICLDISKAFDCIDHNKLYAKLRSCGVAGDVLRWFCNYFDRTQEVKIGNNVSKCKSITT